MALGVTTALCFVLRALPYSGTRKFCKKDAGGEASAVFGGGSMARGTSQVRSMAGDAGRVFLFTTTSQSPSSSIHGYTCDLCSLRSCAQ